MLNVTVENFKDYFKRDFPYLSFYESGQTYFLGQTTYYNVTELFYKVKVSNTTNVPTNTTDWELFNDSILKYILDEDIEKAFAEAKMNINESIFSDEELPIMFMYLSAHYLVLDMKAAQKGINDDGNFPIMSKSVGSVSVSYGLPQNKGASLFVEYLNQTSYGRKYLSVAKMRSIASISYVPGATRP